MRSITVFNFLAEATVLGGAMILLVLLVRTVTGKRMPPSLRALVWLAPALRLLVPLSLPNPMIDSLRPLFSVDTEARPAAIQLRGIVEKAGQTMLRLTGHTGISVRPIVGWLLLAAWMLGAALVLWMLLHHWAAERRRVLRCRVRALTSQEQVDFDALWRFRRKPTVFLCDRITAPYVTGVLHRYLMLPMADAPDYAAGITLCRAFTGLGRTLRIVCRAIHWFNPLVWLGAYLARVDQEALMAPRRPARLRKKLISAVLCLIIAVCLVFSFATRESAPLPTVSVVPDVTWVASASPLHSDMEAIACARRFLESDFVCLNTSACTFSAALHGNVWEIQADREDMEPVLLRYSRDGCLLTYDGTALLGSPLPLDSAYAHPTLTDSVQIYLANFTTALVPGPQWTRASVTADRRFDSCRVLTIDLTNDSGTAALCVSLQIAPVIRIITCETSSETEANG